MAFKETVTAVVVKNAIKYARKDFDKNAPRILSLMEMADVKKVNRSTYAGLHKVLDDPDNNWMRFARDLVCNTDEHVLNQLVQPLMNVAINSYSKRMAAIEKYGCNVPWAILMDPTAACNMRCTGCWAAEYGNKLNLTFDEIDNIIQQGKALGIYMYIYTGGEPLVRKGVDQLVAGLKSIPGIRKVTMTTNGILLAQQLPALLAAGLDSVNISLDTLRPEVFQSITARDEFGHVMEGIHAALDSGIPVKLNCVPQVGVNEGELEDLAALAESRPLQVRFIEMMPIGYGAAMPCISGPELRERFARRWPEFSPLPAAQSAGFGDGPAVYYTVPGWKGDVGFIAAVHGKFCASCNRVRLTSQGFLRPCLASETGCDLRTLLRGGAADEELLQAIRETIWSKPREHHFGDNSMPATRGMYRIGG